MDILIPFRFYGIDSIFYAASAIIGFLVSYNALKLYNLLEKKSHFYLHLSFTILSMGLLILAATTAYEYIHYFTFGPRALPDTASFVDDFGYWIYYGCSIIAYLLLALMYMPQTMKFPIFLPVWSKGYPYFNATSFFILSFVIFRSVSNFFEKRDLNKFLVMISFLAIGTYHLLLFLTSFSKVVYVLAHVSLLVGFCSLLLMLIRVNRQ